MKGLDQITREVCQETKEGRQYINDSIYRDFQMFEEARKETFMSKTIVVVNLDTNERHEVK